MSRPAPVQLYALAPAGRTSDHPAYDALFDAYRLCGRSYARALAIVTEYWDVTSLGALPSEDTVARWAKKDGWDHRINEETLASLKPMYALTTAMLS